MTELVMRAVKVRLLVLFPCANSDLGPAFAAIGQGALEQTWLAVLLPETTFSRFWLMASTRPSWPGAFEI
jgi:hypothetical protein